ncbi:MAG: cell division protein FtsQ [Lachnospiraceae bacterium]|nr:cell division protein FtsQ [Lachnospiraceae bacterium]
MIKEERKRERKRKRRWKAFWITLLTLLVVAGIAFLTAWYFFRVKKVVVEGNELYEDSVIEDAILNDEFSWNTLYVYFKYKFTTPEAIPFIDTVEVSLDNPSTLHIKVYEKGVMGYFYDENEEQNVYFDKDGFVAEISQRVVEGVPLIKGLEYEEINLYEKLDINQSVLSDLLTLTQTLKRNELVPDSIIYGKENSPILVYKNVWVQLGSIDLISLKLEHLAQILPTLSEESGVLHMENWTEDASNIVFDRDE